MNNHYNGAFLEPGENGRSAATASRCSSGSSARWPTSSSADRPGALSDWSAMRQLAYNDLSADRQVVAAVQAMEAILAPRRGEPNCVASHQRSARVVGPLPARTGGARGPLRGPRVTSCKYGSLDSRPPKTALSSDKARLH